MVSRKKSGTRKKAPITGPPTVEELAGGTGAGYDADLRCVVEHFLGLTQEEARVAIETRGILLADDFGYMADAGLRYYLPAAFEYLRSDESKNALEFCLFFLGSLRSVIRRTHSRPAPDIVALVKEIAGYCASCPEKFDPSFGPAWSCADTIADILRQ